MMAATAYWGVPVAAPIVPSEPPLPPVPALPPQPPLPPPPQPPFEPPGAKSLPTDKTKKTKKDKVNIGVDIFHQLSIMQTYYLFPFVIKCLNITEEPVV